MPSPIRWTGITHQEARELVHRLAPGANWRDTLEEYEEIEFRCANSSYPNYSKLLEKHIDLYYKLQLDGLLPYRQDFSSGDNAQYALAVVILDPTKKKYALLHAKEVGLPIDVIQTASQQKVQEIKQSRYDYQIPFDEPRTDSKSITRKDAQPVLKALRAIGLKPMLIGSLAKTGLSSHDIDIKVPFIAEGEVSDPMEYPEYAGYHNTMQGLGFTLKDVTRFDREGGEEDEVETWLKGDLVVDVFPQALEPGIDISRKETRNRPRKSHKVQASLKGVR